jgi:transposase InsO family protein
MKAVLQPWQLLLLILAGWINRHQQDVLEYLRAENQVLKQKLGKKRILLSDDQRRRLAIKGKILGRKALQEIPTIFTPDTILRWHRELVARKWDYSERRQKLGRPPVSQEIIELLLRMARENPTWGYDRLQGALANLGHRISDSTVANILREHGLEPAPERKRQTTWHAFLKAHWDVLAAIDFTTIEVWTRGGLVTFYLLFVMELASRRVQLAGCTSHPTEAWMLQVGRNLTDPLDGFLRHKRYLLMDRDSNHCQAFRDMVEQAGPRCVRLPPRSPNLSAHLERFMRSIKEECLGRMILFGESSLRNAAQEFISHYHAERNHQGLGNRLIEPGEEASSETGKIGCRERLGGMLRYYYRRAA